MKTDDKTVRVGVYEDSPWTLTHTGRKLIYLEPTVDMISIDDIVYSTGNLCRFTGATSQFYSVAQHSVMVCKLVRELLDDALWENHTEAYWNQILAGLLHDAAEAYINDLASPLKVAINGRYKEIENGLLATVFNAFEVPFNYMNAIVKQADNMAIQIERYYFMPDHPEWPKVSDDQMTYPKPPFRDPISAAKIMHAEIMYAMVKREDARLRMVPQ